MPGSVLDEGVDLVVLELRASLQELELDQARDAADHAAAAFDERDRRLRRPAGGQDVVDDQDALALLDRVPVELERGRSVLE